MKNLLFIGSWERDFRELERSGVSKKYNIMFDSYSQAWASTLTKPKAITGLDLQQALTTFIEEYVDKSIEGIAAPHDYPSSILGSIVAQSMKLIGPSPDAVLRCQHKYYSRCDQQKYVPEAVPKFQLVDPRCPHINQDNLTYPLILKPVKSSFSINTFIVNSLQELESVIPSAAFSDQLLVPFNYFLKHFSSYEVDAQHLLIEDCVVGKQCTIEGYVLNGEIGFFGVVDSIMYPGTISFERFEYPSQLSESVQKRMEDIAQRLVKGIGFDNGLFNIEYMYNPVDDRIYIIEINPRMASQFADLYERVDGTNSYETLCDVAAGVKPVVKKRQGEFACAASCVLRTFQDHEVIQSPTQQHIDSVMNKYPDARIEIYAKNGKTLSYELQDGKSYRYGLVHLGGSSIEDILDRLAWCKQHLPFDMKPVN